MEGAARHAQRLAGNFLEDMEAIQKASRARDRRAMSHFETNSTSSSAIYPPPMDWIRRRRSLSGTPFKTTCYPMIYYSSTALPRRRSLCIPRHQYSLQLNEMHILNQRVSHCTASSAYQTSETNDYFQPQYNFTQSHLKPVIWYNYDVNTPTNNEILPTSYLHASAPPRQHILTPKAQAFLKYRSLQNLSALGDDEDSVPRIIHTSYSRNFPMHTNRLSSVPPSSVGTYRSTITTSDYGLPPIVHRNYSRTSRHVYETPYYTTQYSNRISEPVKTTYYSVGPRRFSYYYPPVVTSRPLSSSGSYSNLSSDMQAERRRIERRMDDLLEYKLPPPEYYREMRGSLRALNDKLDAHRKMLDRYSGIDMNTSTASVQDRIESKYQQLASRMGRRTTAMGRD
ncbi:unnamed protein product [Heterobilharzia americana]|nr:unnamed protein product [Heterobilharzia americana]